ncbi:MAG: glycosyltransferase family 2 protein [Bacteroidota bacterium]|jgi:glycosyltransferase involved in cell wall biosynthesis
MNLSDINNFNNSANPLISIITVCLNAEKHILKCIQSVQKYGGRYCEHIIIDGESNDQTVQIIKDNPSSISFWISEKDYGIYNAMNKGVKYAKGKWILFLGADDQLNNNFQEIIPQLLDNHCVYYGDYISEGKKYGGKFSSYRLAKSNFCQQCVLYPIEVFNKYLFNEKYKISADHLLNIQCWTDKSFTFKYIPVSLTIFNSTGISNQLIDTELENDRSDIIKKYFGTIIFIRYLIKKQKLRLYRKLRLNKP